MVPRALSAALLATLLAGCGETTECTFPDPPLQKVAVQRVWPGLTFHRPAALRRHADRWYVAERDGLLWTFPDRADPGAATVALDLSARVFTGGDVGLLSFALHPERDEIYLSYGAEAGTEYTSRVTRMTSPDGGLTFDPNTEQVLLSIRQGAVQHVHSNADLRFGPDGLLYVGLGDGGPIAPPPPTAQDPYDLRGKILRLDVDGGDPYAIPAGNPFADGSGAPEVFALGLRNPFRMHLDPATGDLWAGDVGNMAWEEIDRIEAGDNLGWPIREGAHCLSPPCSSAGLVDPVAEYPHHGPASITLGPVYRGAAIEGLQGRVLVGDWATGALQAVGDDGVLEFLGDGGHGAVDFAETADREVILLDYSTGGLFELVPGDAAIGAVDDFPRLLSETGCMRAGDPRRPRPALVPYEINVPFWSDGATKTRHLSLPEGEAATVLPDGDLELPVGSVLIKEFEWQGEHIETRLLARHDDGQWAGYTYRWRNDQTDAMLIPSREHERWEWSGHWWDYPSRTQCLECHVDAAGSTLGLELAQLDRPIRRGGRAVDQVQAWLDDGLLEGPVGDVAPLAPIDGDAPLAERARSWLHANCAYCHRPGGTGRGDLDLRANTPLAATALCDEPPQYGDLGVDGARRLAPGSPEQSVLSLRIRTLGEARMPPLGSKVVDEQGAALIDAWIASLDACPE